MMILQYLQYFRFSFVPFCRISSRSAMAVASLSESRKVWFAMKLNNVWPLGIYSAVHMVSSIRLPSEPTLCAALLPRERQKLVDHSPPPFERDLGSESSVTECVIPVV